jgi:prephenate dehydratase
MKIGVSGDKGSFSEEVGLLYAEKRAIEEPEIQYLINMEGVLAALSRGEIELGVFPVVNMNSGLVWPAFYAMGKYSFTIIDEWHLDVQQCLFAKRLMSLPEITTIYSYAPAFNQCKIFLQKAAGIPLIDWGDMAKAARDLNNGILAEDAAVIGSARAAQAYNLHILAENIQDVKPNITMFVIAQRGG